MEPIIAGRDLRKSWGPMSVLEPADFLVVPVDPLSDPTAPGEGRLAAGITCQFT